MDRIETKGEWRYAGGASVGSTAPSPCGSESKAVLQDSPTYPQEVGEIYIGAYAPTRRFQGLRGWMSRCRHKLPLPRAWHLRVDGRRVNRLYVSLITHATGQEREALAVEWGVERAVVDEAQRSLLTEQLQKKATRFVVSLPLLSSVQWERGPHTGLWYLTPEGTEQIRCAIYEERKRRQGIWGPWIMAGVGVLGTLIGLILAVKKG